MVKKILNTFLSKLLIAAASFLVVVLTARELGAEARGEISFIVIGIHITTLLSSLIGGTSLIYLIPRKHLISLIIPSYVWGLAMGILSPFLLSTMGLIPSAYTLDLVVISSAFCITAINQYVLLGKEKVFIFNLIGVLQVVLLLVSLIYLLYFQNKQDVSSYILALYISHGASLLVSLIFVSNYIKFSQPFYLKLLFSNLNELISHGFLIQIASITQLLNYRFNYYLLEEWHGLAAVGVFSVAMSIGEGIWIISKSISTVQYSRISNSKNEVYALRLTGMLFKFVLITTVVGISVLLILPQELYSYIFGEEFSNLRPVIAVLSPGILFLAISSIISHYYSGKGKFRINTISSLIGMVATVISGVIFVPTFNFYGAGISLGIANLAILIFLLNKSRKIGFSKFIIIKKSDWKFLKQQINLLGSK